MRAGKLRHRITFQNYVEIVGNGGERTKTWDDAATVWASIEPISAKENNSNEKTQHQITHKITIRNQLPSAVNSGKYRALFGSRVFHVSGATSKDERGIMTELMCEEVAGVTP